MRLIICLFIDYSRTSWTQKKIVKSCGANEKRAAEVGDWDITLSQLMKLDLVTNSSIVVSLHSPPVCVNEMYRIFHLNRKKSVRSRAYGFYWRNSTLVDLIGSSGFLPIKIEFRLFRRDLNRSKWKCFEINSCVSLIRYDWRFREASEMVGVETRVTGCFMRVYATN